MATFTDDFDYPDGPLAGNGGWVTIPNTTSHNVSGDQVVSQNVGTVLGTFQQGTMLDTGDHYVQATVNLNGSTDGQIGVWCRLPLSEEVGYWLIYSIDGLNGAQLELFRVDGFGTYVELDSTAVAGTGSHVIRIEAQGTTLRGYFDGVHLVTGLNQTSYQAYLRVGIEGFGADDFAPSLDNFTAGDLSAVTEPLLYVGDSFPIAVRFGDQTVNSIYVGDVQVWPTVDAEILPSDISGLVGWWDASDAATVTLVGPNVTAWADKSAIGVDLAVNGGVTQGTKNGLTTMNHGDGAGGFTSGLISPALITGDEVTVLVVCEQQFSAGSLRAFSIQSDAGTQDWNNQQSNAVLSKEGGVFPSFYRNGDTASWAGGNQVDVWIVAGVVHDGATGTVYVNGTAGGADASTGDFLVEHVGVGMQAKSGDVWRGEIAEAVVYDRALTGGEISNLQSYFAAKWEL